MNTDGVHIQGKYGTVPFQTASLILASESPRRKDLLQQAGLQFSVVPSAFDERTISLKSPDVYVKILAEYKAKEVSDRFPESWVIGADTVVIINGDILGKPVSEADARIMLTRLSGRTHQVMTGFCITCRSQNRLFSDAVCTDVEFKHLTPEEIDWYVGTNEPFDKAGAYAIQGLGTVFVKKINGSYTNVVGLPVCEVIDILIREGAWRFISEARR